MVAIGPLLVTAIIGAACSVSVSNTILKFVQAHWSKFSDPLTKLLAANTDKFIAILGTVMVLPCIVTGLFVGLRTVYYSAWMVPMWAQVAFWASVTGLLSGLGTLLWGNYAMLVTRVATRWQNIKSQFGVEDMLTEDFVNYLVAGIAITGLLPIVAAIVYSLLRSVYNFGKLQTKSD